MRRCIINPCCVTVPSKCRVIIINYYCYQLQYICYGTGCSIRECLIFSCSEEYYSMLWILVVVAFEFSDYRTAVYLMVAHISVYYKCSVVEEQCYYFPLVA